MTTPAPQPKALLRTLLPSLLRNAVLPLAVYLVLSPRLHNDVLSLGIGAAIPVVLTAAGFAIRRRLDPVGVSATVMFGIVLIVLGLTGGNPLVLKLHDAIVTGPLGLVLLVSAAIGRPLLLVAFRMIASRKGADIPAGPAQRRALSVMTALIGALLFVHAALLLVLALTLSTSTFLAIGRPIGWAVIAAGAVGVVTYRRHLHTALHNRVKSPNPLSRS
ncbi:VC0807 family protein [Amycolatopsis alkalitolerans]|uniref:DUF3159 domain-containing protein n=1 Tax=Amycolatopsis alkalitolerans TaxID=2547244 RepID=A0A5C4M141_9PSEU|nr:VC0807 family protein [Amycolatopsis alkalitolerans]TNC23440.1 hypothetical protein FG385_22160 [Amycolatopsis alkalitolerans]